MQAVDVGVSLKEAKSFVAHADRPVSGAPALGIYPYNIATILTSVCLLTLINSQLLFLFAHWYIHVHETRTPALVSLQSLLSFSLSFSSLAALAAVPLAVCGRNISGCQLRLIFFYPGAFS